MIVMRPCLEQPCTHFGGKSLIDDPDINNEFDINKCLRATRQLFVDLTALKIPLASEMVDNISPQYFSGLLSLGLIGARMAGSHELASRLSFPTGFENGADGSVDTSAGAVTAARQAHHFFSMTKSGIMAIVDTKGNQDGFVVFRGGQKTANYDAESIQEVKKKLNISGLPQRIMVDCGDGNYPNIPTNQLKVIKCIGDQIAAGEDGIMGVMIESNFNHGTYHLRCIRRTSDTNRSPHAEKVSKDRKIGFQYNGALTDGCIGWLQTVHLMEDLAVSVKERNKMRTLAP